MLRKWGEEREGEGNLLILQPVMCTGSTAGQIDELCMFYKRTFFVLWIVFFLIKTTVEFVVSNLIYVVNIVLHCVCHYGHVTVAKKSTIIYKKTYTCHPYTIVSLEQEQTVTKQAINCTYLILSSQQSNFPACNQCACPISMKNITSSNS